MDVYYNTNNHDNRDKMKEEPEQRFCFVMFLFSIYI